MLETRGYNVYYSMLADINGVDIIASKDGKRYLIQIKSYNASKKISKEEIQLIESQYNGKYCFVVYSYKDLCEGCVKFYVAKDDAMLVFPNQIGSLNKIVTPNELLRNLMKDNVNYEKKYISSTVNVVKQESKPEDEVENIRYSLKQCCGKCTKFDSGRVFYYDNYKCLNAGYKHCVQDEKSDKNFQPVLPILSRGSNNLNLNHDDFDLITFRNQDKIYSYFKDDLLFILRDSNIDYSQIESDIKNKVKLIESKNITKNNKSRVFIPEFDDYLKEINKQLIPHGVKVQLNDVANGGGKTYVNFAISKELLSNLTPYAVFDYKKKAVV